MIKKLLRKHSGSFSLILTLLLATATLYLTSCGSPTILHLKNNYSKKDTILSNMSYTNSYKLLFPLIQKCVESPHIRVDGKVILQKKQALISAWTNSANSKIFMFIDIKSSGKDKSYIQIFYKKNSWKGLSRDIKNWLDNKNYECKHF